jgi:hypothetical protein
MSERVVSPMMEMLPISLQGERLSADFVDNDEFIQDFRLSSGTSHPGESFIRIVVVNALMVLNCWSPHSLLHSGSAGECGRTCTVRRADASS